MFLGEIKEKLEKNVSKADPQPIILANFKSCEQGTFTLKEYFFNF